MSTELGDVHHLEFLVITMFLLASKVVAWDINTINVRISKRISLVLGILAELSIDSCL